MKFLKKYTYKQIRKNLRLALVLFVLFFPMYSPDEGWHLWVISLMFGESDMAFVEFLCRGVGALVVWFGLGYGWRGRLAAKVFRTEEDEPMDRDLEWPEHLQAKPKNQKAGEKLNHEGVMELLIPLTSGGFSCEYAHSYGEATFTCKKEDVELQICTDYESLYCMVKTATQPLIELSRSKLLTPQQKNAYRKATPAEKLSLLGTYFGIDTNCS